MQIPLSDGLIDCLAEHVVAGRDVRLAAAAAARLAQLATRLDSAWRIVPVTAPQGGLSLSALIAQLSGRNCFDDQDDSALEIGFRRLADRDPDSPRTLLLLDAVHGLQRPVLRYLQHVGRNAPALVFAIAAGPDLDDLLSDPALAKLRARLSQIVDTGDRSDEPPVAATQVALRLVPSASAAEALAPVAIPADWDLDKPAIASKRAPSRRLLWAASCVGMAASVALGAWLGHASAGVDRLAALEAATNSPLAVAPPAPPSLIAADAVLPPATAVAPATAAAPAVPTPAAPAPPTPFGSAPPTLFASAPPPLATAPLPGGLAGLAAPPQAAALPPPALAQGPAPASTLADRPPALLTTQAPPLSDHSVRWFAATREAHRPFHPLRRARPTVPSDAARYDADARSIPFYGTEGLPPERDSLSRRSAPIAAERDPYLRDDRAYATPFIGTFSTEPYDARYYGYDR